MKIYRWIQCISYYTALFIKVWTQVLCRFKPCLHRVRDLQGWESLTMVPVGNKASFCQLTILQKQFIIIIYAYTCTLGNIQTSTNFLLIVKIDWNLFLKDNTLKKLICTKITHARKHCFLLFVFIDIVISTLQMKTIHTFWKRKFLGVWWVVANKFKLLLEFYWMSSGRYSWNAWIFPSISCSTAKCNKTHGMRKVWQIYTHTFPIVWVLFFPLDSHPMVYFTIWEMRGFLHQFAIVWENATKSIVWCEPWRLVLMLFP